MTDAELHKVLLLRALCDMAYRSEPDWCWCIESPRHTEMCRQAREAVKAATQEAPCRQ